MQEFGYALAGLAGFSLGLVGGGGALLTVPILIYGFHLAAPIGTAYSLFIVGVTSLFGALLAHRGRRVVIPIAFAFALPSFIGILLARTILHRIPGTFAFGGLSLSRDSLLMEAFGIVMIGAAMLTLRSPAHPDTGQAGTAGPSLWGLGFGVGALTGLFGAGGGFLIVPALALRARLPMEKAVGTSLAIIAANSWFGLAGDWGRHQAWNWPFILLFTSLSMAGVLLGQALGGRIPGQGLKTAFAFLTFTVGLIIFLREMSQGVL